MEASLNSTRPIKTVDPVDYLMILRGLSALAVVFCHFPFALHHFFSDGGFLSRYIGKSLDWIFDPFGYIPVLIFFSLSGYLITLGFFTERHNAFSMAGIARYYYSRACRILPLYYFSIVLCAVLYWDLTLQHPLRVAALFAFIENYKPTNGIIFNHVYWTMPVEMLYFLMAPFIFLLMHKTIAYLNSWIFLCIGIAIFLCITLFIFFDVPYRDGVYLLPRKTWSLIARFDFFYNLMAFVLGGACVFIVKNRLYFELFSHYRNTIKVLACGLLLGLVAYCSGDALTELNSGRFSYFIVFGLTPCIALFVLCVAILNETQVVRPRAYLRYCVHLGLLSYGLYLFHMPVLDSVQIGLTVLQLSLSTELVSLIALCMTLLLSHITYRFIERPFLYRKT